jgi:phosphate starvation-inducible PhoH-like protein
MGSRVSKRKQRQAERNWKPPQIETLTQRQATYLDLLNSYDCTVAVGPAGTGKTFVACAWAGAELHAKTYRSIVLARPNVGVGKTLGMLPGRLEQKLAPWARPLAEAFKQQMSAKRYDDAIRAGEIQIEAIEHIRGLTFDNTVMIIDEAQNTTPGEMKAFLTRIGEDSVVILCGDISQSDLHRTENGLAWATRAVDRGLVTDVGLIAFEHADVVRSELCKQWGEAFDTMEAEREKAPTYHGSLSKLMGGEFR